MKRDNGLDMLLSMDGYTHVLDNSYWWKIEARMCNVTEERPHGIRYALTLHDNHSKRVFGMDNAHIPKNKRKGFHGQIIEYDHVHNTKDDKGTPYAFVSAEKLMIDFFARVDSIIADIDK